MPSKDDVTAHMASIDKNLDYFNMIQIKFADSPWY